MYFRLCVKKLSEQKCKLCNAGREASAGGRRLGCVLHECMKAISVGLLDPLNHLHSSLQRPAAGCGASLCLPFVMRCHLALLAAQSLVSLSVILIMNMTTLFLHFLSSLDGDNHPPVHIWMHSSFLLAPCFPSPLLFFSKLIHINEASSSVFPTSASGIVKLWSRREGL